MGMLYTLILNAIFQLMADDSLYKPDYQHFTEVLQVPEFYNHNIYTDNERCQIARWVHENNSVYVNEMYLKGHNIHPSRLKSTSDDIAIFCSSKKKSMAATRCGRFDDCLNEAEILRLIIER